jgi:transcriptional regulator with XRE-family HTH domain
MNIGEILKRERINQGISIYALSKKTGIAISIISRWEKGIHQPSFANVDKALNG